MKVHFQIRGVFLLALLALAATVTTGRAQTCTVDWNNVHQRIDGFGASSAWRSTWSTAQADMLFSTNNSGIALSLLRNHIAYANTTSSNDTPTTVETSIMQMAQTRGALVWSAPWTPPAGFKNTNDIYDSNHATGNGINGGSYNGSGNNITNLNYASQLANYVYSMEHTYGVNIYGISVQNEPDANVTSYEACQWSGTQIHDFVTNLYAALVTKGVGSTRIILPESENWSAKTGLYTPTLNDANSAAAVSVIANHNYDGVNFQTGATTTPAALSVNGKSLWETEVSTGDTYNNSISNGVYWAKRIYLFLTAAQANGYHYWWLISGNADNEGLTDNAGNPAKRMYALGQYSRFVRPGYYRIDAANTGSAFISAYMYPNSGNFAIVAVNTNATTAISQTFNLNNFPGTVTSVTPWITSATMSISNQPSVAVTSGSFTYTLPALSVVTFASETNLAPVDIALPSSSVSENLASGATVGTFVTIDPDSGNTFTYALVSGTGSDDNASFSISGSTLKTAATFDYEARNSYSIRVRSTDQDGLFVEKALTISILNVNEAPTDIALSNSSVPENQPAGTAVGTFSTTDPDSGNTFTYTLVSGTGSTDNGSFTISSGTLLAAAPFDYESKSSYSIRVRSTDQGGLFVEKTFTIIVTDANDAPGLTPVADQTINAGQTLLVTNVATDQDQPPQTLTFSLLSGPAGGAFTRLDATDAQFSWRPLVSQAGTTNPVMVVVTDNGTPNLSATDSFNVIVNPLIVPSVSSINASGRQVTLVVTGTQGPDYTVWTTTNLTDPVAIWQVLLTTNSPITPVTLVDTNSTDPARFYLIQIGP